MLRKILLGSVALFAAGAAQAADLPSRKAPVPVAYAAPVFTWTGFYVGLNAGAAIRQNNWGVNFVPGAAFFGVPNNNNNVGFTGGAQIGYNWQMSAFVFGLEADLNYLSAQNAASAWWLGGANNSSGGLLGTVRGRLGLALDRWMVYATGGFAYGNAYYNSWYPFAAGGFWNQTSSGMKIGYTVGGGVEYALSDAWSIKAEYLFTDIRRNNDNNFGFAPAYWNRSTQNHIVRAGVNYHFNWGNPSAAVARY